MIDEAIGEEESEAVRLGILGFKKIDCVRHVASNLLS